MNSIKNGFFLCMLSLLWCLVDSRISTDPFSHSHSLNTECVMKPPQSSETQGILKFSRSEADSDEEWKIDGNGSIREMTQRIQLHQGNIYSFSAWVKLREGNDKKVGVVFRTENGRLVHGGEVRAKQGCWTLLKGGIVPDFSGPVNIFFESENRGAKISANNVLLKQFSKDEWKLKQDQLIEKIRKSKVRFEVTYQNKTAVTLQENTRFAMEGFLANPSQIDNRKGFAMNVSSSQFASRKSLNVASPSQFLRGKFSVTSPSQIMSSKSVANIATNLRQF